MMHLVKIIYIYSVFGEPLGNPVYTVDTYPNVQLCQAYLENHMSNFPQKLSLEYNAYSEAKCMTPEEFAVWSGQTAPPQTQKGLPFID